MFLSGKLYDPTLASVAASVRNSIKVRALELAVVCQRFASSTAV
jgi:hypothetical protein